MSYPKWLATFMEALGYNPYNHAYRHRNAFWYFRVKNWQRILGQPKSDSDMYQRDSQSRWDFCEGGQGEIVCAANPTAHLGFGTAYLLGELLLRYSAFFQHTVNLVGNLERPVDTLFHILRRSRQTLVELNSSEVLLIFQKLFCQFLKMQMYCFFKYNYL